MQLFVNSLRSRLFFMILLPLVILSILLGSWRYIYDLETAEDLFDRSLLSAALSVSRDVAITDGDVVSHATRKMISEAAGGEIFYHVSGAGGIYLTGYAYPPVDIRLTELEENKPVYFEATYRGEKVRVLVIKERIENATQLGDTIVTVWQRLEERELFSSQMGIRTFSLLVVLMCVLAAVVWLSVERGLLPLTGIQDAISKRSPDDLSPIKRNVPNEVKGIVTTLNLLFDQLSRSIQSQQNFISDAAHQLRNPANALQSMAESLQEASNEEDRTQRTGDLVKAARLSARLAEQLLSLERLNTNGLQAKMTNTNLNDLMLDVCQDAAPPLLKENIEFEFLPVKTPLPVCIDPVFVAEAVRNLIDNALKHGGKGLSRISLETGIENQFATITIHDDGKGMSPVDSEKAFSRFGQLEPSSGSGLGLAIVTSVVQQHGGNVRIDPMTQGASLTVQLPLQSPVAPPHID